QYKDPQPIEVEQLEETSRSDKGFGHSGINSNNIDINILEYEDLDENGEDIIIQFDNVEMALQVLAKEISKENHLYQGYDLNEVTLKDDEPQIPNEYKEFEQLFKDKDIGTLPPHRAYDHTIPLEPGKTAPFGRIYNLSQTELKELYNYIQEN